MTSRTPRCPDCTKHMLAGGVRGLWLFHEAPMGWTFYPMAKAHAMSLEARNLPVSYRGQLDVEETSAARKAALDEMMRELDREENE